MSSFLIDSSKPPSNNNNITLQQQDKSKSKEESAAYLVKATFMITYILLLTTATITFIEAMRTDNPLIRHIFNLETCISLVASYFYSVFVAQLEGFEKEKKPIDWATMTKTRYIDWAITTPLMLLVLCAFLANESKTTVHLSTISMVVLLNYIMLYFGYLGETKQVNKPIADAFGFVSFFAMFYLIYYKYIKPKFSFMRVESNP